MLVGASGDRSEQICRLVEVLKLEHLDRRVHVPVRDTDVQRRDTATGGVERVGVGPRAAARCFELYLDIGCPGSLPGCLDDRRVVRAATGDDRSTAELDTGVPLRRGTRFVGRVSHVDRDCGVGRQIEPDHLCALQTDLLLDGADRTDRRPGVFLCCPAEPLGSRPDADAVVQPPGRDATVLQVGDSLFERDRVPPLDEFLGCLAVADTDVDVLLRDVVDTIVVTVAQVNRRLTDDTRNRPVVGVDGDVLTFRYRAVRTADARQVDEPTVVDVTDDEPDLVAVARERDRRLTTLDDRDRVAVRVGRDSVRELRDVLNPDALTRCLD